MKVLFLAAPDLNSHLYIQVPLAWALRAAGHEVRVTAQPDMKEGVSGTGLTGTFFGQEMSTYLMSVDEEAEPPPPPPRAGGSVPMQTEYAQEDPYGELEYLTWNLFRHLCPESMLDDLVEQTRQWRPDLVIWDQICFAGAVAARACGAAHARLLFGTDGVTQLRNAAQARGALPPDPLREWLEPVLQRYGCEYGDDVPVGNWTIDTMPPWTWQPEGPAYVPMRHLAFNGPSTVPDWLRTPSERTRVCLTLGLSHRDAQTEEASAADLLEAVAGLDIEVVATFDGDQLAGVTSLPDNVRIEEFVPMNVLLPTCAAVVHQGGAGTFATAVEYGVPQLIVPSAYWNDKWYGSVAQANALAAEGAGLYLAADSRELSPAGLRDGLSRVLGDPSFRANAERLRTQTLGVPTPHDIVPVLEKLTAAHRLR